MPIEMISLLCCFFMLAGWCTYITIKLSISDLKYNELWCASREFVSQLPVNRICPKCDVLEGHRDDCLYNITLRHLKVVLNKGFK